MTKARDDKGAETKANVRATTRPVARTKASEPMAKTYEGEVAEATNGYSAAVTEDAMAKPNNTAADETREDAGIETMQDIRTEIKEDDVTVNIYNFQKLGTEQLEFERLCGLLLSRYSPSYRHRSERLFETVAGEPLYIHCKTARR